MDRVLRSQLADPRRSAYILKSTGDFTLRTYGAGLGQAIRALNTLLCHVVSHGLLLEICPFRLMGVPPVMES